MNEQDTINNSILEIVAALEAHRAADMPTVQDAINALYQAHQRLIELGWEDARFCPKNGTVFRAIEPGSTGIHNARYLGAWPNGSIHSDEDGDLWPFHPCLFKMKNQE